MRLRCATTGGVFRRSEEHTSELQSQSNLVCRLLLEKKTTMPPPHTPCASCAEPRRVRRALAAPRAAPQLYPRSPGVVPPRPPPDSGDVAPPGSAGAARVAQSQQADRRALRARAAAAEHSRPGGVLALCFGSAQRRGAGRRVVTDCRRRADTTHLFFFRDPAPTEIYTLSLHDALPI